MQLLRKARRSGLLAVLLLAMMAPVVRAQDIVQGGKFAERYCARCHAVGTTGVSRHPSAPPFRAIAAKGHVDDLQEALAEGIMVGHADMPEFVLSPDQIADFLAYLKGLAPTDR